VEKVVFVAGTGPLKALAAVLIVLAVIAAVVFIIPGGGPATGYAVAKAPSVGPAAQGAAGTAEPLTKIKVGYAQLSFYLPSFVAKEKGFFEEEGLDAEMVQFKATNQVIDAAVQGKVDFGPAGYGGLFAVESASPGEIRTFGSAVETEAGGNYQNFLLVRKDSPIQNVSQLKGKKIGTYSGTTQVLWLRLMLPKVGLDPEKDVQIIQVAPNLQIEALASGQFDALFTIEPYGTMAVEKGVARVLFPNMRGKLIMDPFPAGPTGLFTADYLKKNPATAAKIRRAIEKAVDYINAHEDGARALLPKYTPLDAGLASKVKLYQFSNAGTPAAEFQKLADLLYGGGDLKKPVDTAAMPIT
jgi:NitT/TauT family transport system substrate-binding protein